MDQFIAPREGSVGALGVVEWDVLGWGSEVT